VGKLADQLRNVVVLLPTEVTVRRCEPGGFLLEILAEGVAEHQGEVVQYLRKIVSELRSIEGIGSRHFLVTLDSRHAIRKDLVAALEKENGKLSPDTLLIWSWLFWLSHCLCRVVWIGAVRSTGLNLPLFEIALVFVRVDHVARFIVNANHGVM